MKKSSMAKALFLAVLMVVMSVLPVFANAEEEQIVIRIAGESQMMVTLLGERYTALHPNVKIEYYNPDGQGYVNNEMLIKWAGAGTLPDIVNIDNPEIAYQHDILVDLTPYYNADPEKSLLYQDIIKYCTTNDQLLMIPYQLFFNTIMVNKTLIDENNLPVPEYGWTVDEFVNIVKTLTVPGETLGTYDANLWQYLIPNYDAKLERSGYCRENKSWVVGEAFKASVDMAADLVTGEYTAAERLNATDNSDGTWANWYALANEIIGTDDPWTSWQQGTVATWLENSYWSTWDVGNSTYGGQDWDCYPIPVWEEGDVSRTCVITDNYAITRGCKHPEVAYDVLKFYTYSMEGFKNRMDIWENFDPEALRAAYPALAEAGAIWDFYSFGLSPVDSQEVRDTWARLYNAKPGLVYMANNLANCNLYLDGGKAIPGFDAVANQIINNAVTNQIFTGEKAAADLMVELQSRCDAAQKEILDAMSKKIK